MNVEARLLGAAAATATAAEAAAFGSLSVLVKYVQIAIRPNQ